MVTKRQQPVSATQEWRQRMAAARADLPKGIGQQDVLIWITSKKPELDRLTNATRWKNAWNKRVADPEFTVLVEGAAIHFKAQAKETSDRLKRMRLKKVQ